MGISDDNPKINTDEVVDWKYIKYDDLKTDMENNPENYTVWFRKIVERVHKHLTV